MVFIQEEEAWQLGSSKLVTIDRHCKLTTWSIQRNVQNANNLATSIMLYLRSCTTYTQRGHLYSRAWTS